LIDKNYVDSTNWTSQTSRNGYANRNILYNFGTTPALADSMVTASPPSTGTYLITYSFNANYVSTTQLAGYAYSSFSENSTPSGPFDGSVCQVGYPAVTNITASTPYTFSRSFVANMTFGTKYTLFAFVSSTLSAGSITTLGVTLDYVRLY
jgi:hypothetical protein